MFLLNWLKLSFNSALAKAVLIHNSEAGILMNSNSELKQPSISEREEKDREERGREEGGDKGRGGRAREANSRLKPTYVLIRGKKKKKYFPAVLLFDLDTSQLVVNSLKTGHSRLEATKSESTKRGQDSENLNLI